MLLGWKIPKDALHMTKDTDVSARKQIKLAFMLSYHLPLTSANYPVKGKTHED